LVDGSTSEKGLHELVSKLENVLSVSYKIAKHKAGIRPTVADRRPLIGKNNNHHHLYFFNGMGTKGVMLAPYFSEIFVNHLLSNTPFDSEIDIARYFS
jgi:glycine/D-amino acid oxidase-like deaminating enzyme